MDDKIICHECQTENEPKYVYCKNCGTLLNENDEKSKRKYSDINYDFSNNTNTGGSTYNGTYGILLDQIEGVSTDDLMTFTGKKSYDIVSKFCKSEITSSKCGWCWPTAILGFVFGPFGSAIWFFYRKMYKLAMIFVAIGIILSASVTIISGSETNFDLKDFYSGNYETFYDNIDEADTDTLQDNIASFFNFSVSLATSIVTGLYGMYFYKKHCLNKIKTYSANMPDPRYYKLGLATIGGTSSGMAVLGVFIMMICENLISLLYYMV